MAGDTANPKGTQLALSSSMLISLYSVLERLGNRACGVGMGAAFIRTFPVFLSEHADEPIYVDCKSQEVEFFPLPLAVS